MGELLSVLRCIPLQYAGARVCKQFDTLGKSGGDEITLL